MSLGNIEIDQFRYIKIQPKTIDLCRVCGVYSPEPRSEVYCVRLNFNISKLVYSREIKTNCIPRDW